jgi:hypothetical protein
MKDLLASARGFAPWCARGEGGDHRRVRARKRLLDGGHHRQIRWKTASLSCTDRGSVGLLPARVAVVDVIAVVTGVKAGLKWPNDVLVGDRKRAGIVAEVAPSGTLIVVGVGVNVTLRPDGVVGDPRVTSPMELKVRNPDRGVRAARPLREWGHS